MWSLRFQSHEVSFPASHGTVGEGDSPNLQSPSGQNLSVHKFQLHAISKGTQPTGFLGSKSLCRNGGASLAPLGNSDSSFQMERKWFGRHIFAPPAHFTCYSQRLPGRASQSQPSRTLAQTPFLQCRPTIASPRVAPSLSAHLCLAAASDTCISGPPSP